jgi:hypothetical protein
MQSLAFILALSSISELSVCLGYGNISIRHRTSADILFIKDGKPQIIFSNVRNAQHIVKLVKSIRRLQLQGQQRQ